MVNSIDAPKNDKTKSRFITNIFTLLLNTQITIFEQNNKIENTIQYLRSIIYLICIIFYSSTFNAQSDKWQKELSDDGKIEVYYAIYDSVYVSGEEITLIEYFARATISTSLENCIEIFNNPEMHKKFYEYTEISDKIKDVSENEWIIYYYYSPPWPIADSDCVSRITEKRDSINNKIIFTSFSEPSLIEMKDVTRSELNNIIFTFTQKNESEVEILIEAKLIPAVSAPRWMMSAWFPDGPAGTLNRFRKLAEEL